MPMVYLPLPCCIKKLITCFCTQVVLTGTQTCVTDITTAFRRIITTGTQRCTHQAITTNDGYIAWKPYNCIQVISICTNAKSLIVNTTRLLNLWFIIILV